MRVGPKTVAQPMPGYVQHNRRTMRRKAERQLWRDGPPVGVRRYEAGLPPRRELERKLGQAEAFELMLRWAFRFLAGAGLLIVARAWWERKSE